MSLDIGQAELELAQVGGLISATAEQVRAAVMRELGEIGTLPMLHVMGNSHIEEVPGIVVDNEHVGPDPHRAIVLGLHNLVSCGYAWDRRNASLIPDWTDKTSNPYIWLRYGEQAAYLVSRLPQQYQTTT